MKTTDSMIRTFFIAGIFVFCAPHANGQFLKKLGKRAERAAERTIERRVDKETTKKTDQALDSILEPGAKDKKKTPTTIGGNAPASNPENGPSGSKAGSKTLVVYSKFDFVPGNKPLFFDDFSNDFIGDFPAKWNTNGSGEIVTIGDSPEKWLELKPGYNILYVPDVPELPEEYTIEFDTEVIGIDQKTSSRTGLQIMLSDDPKFKTGDNYVTAWIPYGQYGAFDIRMRNYINRDRGDINSGLKADIRKAVLNRPHISIAVNKERFRLWVNEQKYVDIPRIMPTTNGVTTLKFNVNNFKDQKERIFISNLKVAEGGIDLRRKLISEGKISTNGILFDSGSDNLKPESMGIIRQISQVLLQEKGMVLKIIGHTDGDGPEDANLKLSKARAGAVKTALVNIYSIDENRLSTEGKGESEPVGDNSTTDGKAQNRRVEFIKQ
ncbi:OmpA family protein [Maribacter sp. 2304DJ31-5]|uniref:OmpA family protein n=1 Tax=Maribacter sp. 2304DJ31-5 TaxID=3386273 RepID=UPI0039BD6EF3